MIKSDLLNSECINHGFFTRSGGVSEGVYKGLNCGAGSKDNPEFVQENKRLAMQALELNIDQLASLYQIHSTEVVLISEKNQLAEKPKADAMVTRLPGIALGILTADCVPILFADVENKVIGAAHSGWKGSVGNIAKNVVDTMIVQGAQKSCIKAVIGPAIQQNSYEVGPDFPAPFLALDKQNERFFTSSVKTGHHMFDLTGFVKAQLDDLSIGSVERIKRDTCTETDMFYSYRRMCKNAEADYGRLLSAISLAE